MSATQTSLPQSQHIQILDYQPQYAKDFKRINLQWIETYFKVEPADLKTLDYPEEKIIKQGGFIFFAKDIESKAIIGTCALLPHDGMFELSKMGVLPEARGKQVGNLLMQAVIQKAQDLQLSQLFLETNSSLKPAIHLYEKYGFRHVPTDPNSPYARADVRMILELS